MIFVVVVITFAILFAFGAGLNALWNAGYWYLVAPVGPAIFAAVWACSSQQDRDNFKRDIGAGPITIAARRALAAVARKLRR